ncbi:MULTISPECIES: histidine phosphatase family protein [unclassified Halomonas]|uniref:histidine phosphatase family protein n=1 Tax=unclassified Halomonas TaxID=2609666 RepID=UPI002076ABDF|nr:MULTISPECIES: histidine phosphatase family protein [unclassified Halomonas]
MASDLDVELVVVRHGVTAWNLERRYQGQRDIELLFPDAEPGLNALKAALKDEHFDAIYASDLTRCRQTLEWAKPSATPASVYLESRLRELDFGEYEGKVYDELKENPGYRAWIDSVGELKIPGGESAGDLRARLDGWLSTLADNARALGHRRVLAVTHGGVIRELRRRFETVDFWEATVTQATGRRLNLTHRAREGEWQCSFSSAVPAQASATP